jgi:hypothetical protein
LPGRVNTRIPGAENAENEAPPKKYDEQYELLVDELFAQYQPETALEEEKVIAIAAKRLRRAKAAIINTTYREALFRVLDTILPETDDRSAVAARLVEDWYEKPLERKTVIDLLTKHGLDPEAACAEAMTLRALNWKRSIA